MKYLSIIVILVAMGCGGPKIRVFKIQVLYTKGDTQTLTVETFADTEFFLTGGGCLSTPTANVVCGVRNFKIIE